MHETCSEMQQLNVVVIHINFICNPTSSIKLVLNLLITLRVFQLQVQYL